MWTVGHSSWVASLRGPGFLCHEGSAERPVGSHQQSTRHACWEGTCERPHVLSAGQLPQQEESQPSACFFWEEARSCAHP